MFSTPFVLHMHSLIVISNNIISQRSGCGECAWKPMTRAGGFSVIDALVGITLCECQVEPRSKKVVLSGLQTLQVLS